MTYGCEVWGFHSANDVEKVHLNFLKSVMSARKNVCRLIIYFELGRLPMIFMQKVAIIKYWCHLLTTSNCILKTCYQEMYLDVGQQPLYSNWASMVKHELYRIGLGHYWLDQHVDNPGHFIKVVKARLKDEFIQQCYAFFNTSSKCLLYKNIIRTFGPQEYLLKSLSDKHKSALFKIRTSSHLLQIEQGRFQNIDRNLRQCTLCDTHDLEDEYHFILCCPFYCDLRLKYIKPFYFHRPSMYKFTELLTSKSVKILSNLSKFIHVAFARRTFALQ